LVTVRRLVPDPEDILQQAAGGGDDLETVTRGLLVQLARLTGLSSTYLAETRLEQDLQYIVFAYNTSQDFHIPEDISLPWSEGVCRFVVEGGPNYTSDAQKAYPSSTVARLLDIRTFVSYPVFAADGHWFGTLCGASKQEVDVAHGVLDLMRECAALIGSRIRAPETA
jgi:diguanylate cyclase